MVYKELSDKGTLKIFKEIDLHRKNIQKKKKKFEVRCLSKDKISVKRKNKCEKNKIKNKQRIALAKQIGPNQNAINLSFLNVTLPQKSLPAKMPSFIPTPAYINWYELWKDCTSFVNQLCYKAKQSQSTSIVPSKNNNINNLFSSSPVQQKIYTFI